MSDGMENEPDYWSTVKASITSAGTVVHTIALGPETDQALMQEIASTTGGDYLYVDLSGASGSLTAAATAAEFEGLQGSVVVPSALALPNRLADAYRLVNEVVLDHQRIWEQASTVPAGRIVRLPVPVTESGLTNAILSANSKDKALAGASVRLFRPDGTEATAASGVQINSSDSHVVFHLGTLKQIGTWQLEIQSAKIDVEYVASLSARNVSGVQLDVYFGQVPSNNRFIQGMPMPILATLTDRKGPIRGARVVAEVNHPDGRTDTLRLFDDGDHEDGAANDGIYGVLYTRTTAGSTTGVPDKSQEPGIRGSYVVRVIAAGKANTGEVFERYKGASFQVYTPDPRLDQRPNPDVDGDGLPDAWEALYPKCLTPKLNDASLDPDGDGLPNAGEFRAGTNPCDPDTDRGGESDGSEVRRGANPLVGRDDSVPRPIDVEVFVPDSNDSVRIALKRNANLIRFPANPRYEVLLLYRAESPRGPFEVVAKIDPRTAKGMYFDEGLVAGRTYYYKIQGIGFNGATTPLSEMFSGTPHDEPFPPRGSVLINDGATFTDSNVVMLHLSARKQLLTETGPPKFTSDGLEMMISNIPSFANASWEPYAEHKPWKIEANMPGNVATVYVKYRDAKTGLESITEKDGIQIVGPGILSSIRGVVKRENDQRQSMTLVHVPNHPFVPPTFTDASGQFTMTALLPFSYTLRFEHEGFQTATVEGVQTRQGGAVDIGTIALPAAKDTGPTATPTATHTPVATRTPTATPTPGAGPVIVDINPRGGSSSEQTIVEIRGAGFRSGARGILIGLNQPFPIENLVVASSTLIKGTVPNGLPAGIYDLQVINQDRTSATLPRAFIIVGSEAVPREIRPGFGLNGQPTEVIIRGLNFKPGMTATLQRGTTSLLLPAVQAVSESEALALVPMGLEPGTYDLIVSNFGSSGLGASATVTDTRVLTQAFSVVSPASDDLAISADDVWGDPHVARTGETIQLGVNIHRLGGSNVLQPVVKFYLGDPGQGGTLIGETQAPPILPATARETVSVQWPVGETAGQFEVFVVVDPDNAIGEATKANNRASRLFTVLPNAYDTTPPNLTGLQINGGAGQTSSPEISVNLTASDPAPGMGVETMFLVEREFNAAARSWVPVATTGWVPLSQPYTMTLTDRAGIRYIQGYVADGAGNISREIVRARIDYLPSADSLREGQVRVFRRNLAAGEKLTARLEPVSGDADLYIWGPEGSRLAASVNDGTAVDEATIQASTAGVYQIEVYAFTDTTYSLGLTQGAGITAAVSANGNLVAHATKARTLPAIAPSDAPGNQAAVPVAPISDDPTVVNRILLPLTGRASSGGW